MTARVLLYGADGRTPVASEKVINDEITEVLIEAFGYCSGMLVAHIPIADRQRIELVMDEARQKILKGVLMLEDIRPAIEQRYRIMIGVTPDGELTVTSAEAMERPPGSPVNPYGA